MLMDVVTIFPDYFESPLRESILKRAQDEGHLEVRVRNLRDFTHDNHRTVDDKPFGGGAGMVMKPEPLFECVEAIPGKGWVVALGPHGDPMSQKIARDLSARDHIIFITGHYEGIDHRVREHLIDQEISIGDFITMGGQAPALCVIESIVRLMPGVLGNEASIENESFQSGGLEYPQFTRPRKFRDWEVPEVLVSGHHEEVAKWRREAAYKITQEKRPDLIRRKQ